MKQIGTTTDGNLLVELSVQEFEIIQKREDVYILKEIPISDKASKFLHFYYDLFPSVVNTILQAIHFGRIARFRLGKFIEVDEITMGVLEEIANNDIPVRNFGVKKQKLLIDMIKKGLPNDN